ncbi:Purine nucleoside phosphoramidase [subsurface metagenome]
MEATCLSRAKPNTKGGNRGKMDCIFCQIVAGEIPSKILYQDEEVIAFRDINPMASTHLLIIPRRHIPSLAHLPDTETPLIGHMVKVANQLAKGEGIAESGYRLVINCGKEGGQLVPHLHMHLLGGRRLSGALG